MNTTKNTTTTKITIIGAGVSGLTLATFLAHEGIPFIVLERRNRAYIESRQRAGVVDARAVRMFENHGLAEKLLGGPMAETIDYRVNGVSHVFTAYKNDGIAGRFCTQQMLVVNLLRELLDNMHGDVRFDAADIGISNEAEQKPIVTYSDEQGSHTIVSDYVVGCDADRGVSRSSIPKGVIKTFTHEFGYAWLAALVEAPVTGHPIMGVSDYGFVGQLPRGPQRSRYYLQCALNDGREQWPDERLWDEIRLRLNDPAIENSQVHSMEFVPLRSVVHEPLQYNNLFLAGDAAHMVPPVSAKGMNLALYDVDILFNGLVKAIKSNEKDDLESYSDTILPHIWNYQDFACWMADTMHDAGNTALHGAFRQKIAKARLMNLFNQESDTAAILHSEFQRGMN